MKRRRVILAAVIACFAIAVLIGALRQSAEKEPSYNGKRLSEWIVLARRSTGYYSSPLRVGAYDAKGWTDSRDAVLHIGTNALPCLLRWLPYRDARWKTDLFNLARKMPASALQSFLVRKLDPNRHERPDNVALTGLVVLGENAGPAVPDLTRLMNNLNDQDTSMKAMLCLACMGEAGQPALRESAALNASDPRLREAVTTALELSKRGIRPYMLHP